MLFGQPHTLSFFIALYLNHLNKLRDQGYLHPFTPKLWTRC